jgi:hypothetical protein
MPSGIRDGPQAIDVMAWAWRRIGINVAPRQTERLAKAMTKPRRYVMFVPATAALRRNHLTRAAA